MHQERQIQSRQSAILGVFSALWFPASVGSWLQLWWPEHRVGVWAVISAVLGLWLGARWFRARSSWQVYRGLLSVVAWVALGPLFLWSPMLRPFAGWIVLGMAFVGGVCWGGAWGILADALEEIWSGVLDLGEVPISLGALLLLGLLLALPFFVRPYLGRLGLHGLVALLWGWFVLYGAGVSGRFSRWVWGAWSVGGIGWCALWVVWVPAALPNHEIVYSSSVGGERVTLNARGGEGMQVLALVSERATIYQSIQAYRTAETMVHPVMATRKTSGQKILLFGGEDGTILREIAKYPEGTEVVWVPLFSTWAAFFQRAPHFSAIHQHARKKLKITTLHLSAFFQHWEWFALLKSLKHHGHFSVILSDLPPPTEALSMLYAASTKKALLEVLSPDGVLVEATASPYRQRRLFWCLSAKWAESGAHVVPFQLSPSLLGDHGFVWVLRKPYVPTTKPLKITVPTRYLTSDLPFHTFLRFARDVNPDGRDMQGKCILPTM